MSDSFVTPWTTAHQTLLSVGLSWQEYWSGLPFFPPDCVWGGMGMWGVCVCCHFILQSVCLCVSVCVSVCVSPERSLGQARSRRLVWGLKGPCAHRQTDEKEASSGSYPISTRSGLHTPARVLPLAFTTRHSCAVHNLPNSTQQH